MPLEIKACAGSHCTAIFAMFNSCWSKMFEEVESAENIPLGNGFEVHGDIWRCLKRHVERCERSQGVIFCRLSKSSARLSKMRQ